MTNEFNREERVSQAVGTTVRIVDFLKTLPVRRQTALKTSARSLAKVKKLLQAYALARPSVRLSMKLLKAKDDKGNWIYAPQKADGIPEAAIKIVGKKLAEQCRWKTWSSSSLEPDKRTPLSTDLCETEHGSYIIEAFLPTPNYGIWSHTILFKVGSSPGIFLEVAVVSHVGQFISIDSRPVSCLRGTLKHIISLYKSYIVGGNLVGKVEKLKDPFICMNIICPPGTYDPNVEPAKDDVLFTNADFVTKLTEDFFRNVYGDLRTQPSESVPPQNLRARSGDFDVLLARKLEPVPVEIPNQLPHGLKLVGLPRAEQQIGSSTSASQQAQLGLAVSSGEIDKDNMVLTKGNIRRTSGSLISRDHLLRKPFNPEIEDTGKPKSPKRRQGWLPDMYAVDEGNAAEPFGLQNPVVPSLECKDNEEGESLRDVRVSNPWTFAKINTSVHRPNKGGKDDTRIERQDQLLTPRRQFDEIDQIGSPQVLETQQSVHSSRCHLPTPMRSQLDRSPRAASQSSSPDSYPFPLKAWAGSSKDRAPKAFKIANRVRNEVRLLDKCIQRSPDDQSVSFVSKDNHMLENSGRDFVSARMLPMGTPSAAMHEASTSPTRSLVPRDRHPANANRPFVSPISNHEPSLFRTESKQQSLRAYLEGTKGSTGTTTTTAPISVQNEDEDIVFRSVREESMHPDLARTMDYEARKIAAVKQWKANQRQQAAVIQPLGEQRVVAPSSPTTSPHRNRYKKAVAALQPSEDSSMATNVVPAFLPGDPRAYLIRAQQREASAGPDEISSRLRKRRKTSCLPLETVQEENIARDLILPVDTKGLDFQLCIPTTNIAGRFCDEYISSGIIAPGFSATGLSVGHVHKWEDKIKELIKTSFRKVNDVPDVQIDIWSTLQDHIAAHP